MGSTSMDEDGAAVAMGSIHESPVARRQMATDSYRATAERCTGHQGCRATQRLLSGCVPLLACYLYHAVRSGANSGAPLPPSVVDRSGIEARPLIAHLPSSHMERLG